MSNDIKRKRTWRVTNNYELKEFWEEICEKAKSLNLLKLTPELYIYKSSRNWGQCYCIANNLDERAVVILNEVLENDLKGAKETLLHELAHACTPGDNHNWKWQRCARKLGSYYGIYHFNRLSGPESHNGINLPQETINYKKHFEIVCCDCGKHYHYVKNSHVVKQVRAGTKTCVCPCGSRNLKLI